MEGKKKLKEVLNLTSEPEDYTGFWQIDDKAKHKISRGMRYRAEHCSIPDANDKCLLKNKQNCTIWMKQCKSEIPDF